jgi:hypothetical protein
VQKIEGNFENPDQKGNLEEKKLFHFLMNIKNQLELSDFYSPEYPAERFPQQKRRMISQIIPESHDDL